jgi:hypothetical protein
MVARRSKTLCRFLDTFAEELGRWLARTICVSAGTAVALVVQSLLG